VFLLRRALGAKKGSEYIQNVPPRGDRFCGAVRTVEIPCSIDSIAVLPLINFGGNPSQEYFADGITDALITELAKNCSLPVFSRTSFMRYNRAAEPVSQIARALRFTGILEGSVVKSDDRVRITVQLIHADSDQHIWTDVYDCAMADVLEMQSRVARDVAAGI